MNVVVKFGLKRGKLVKVEKKGLLFLSYGSPLSKDDLVPYMTSIRRGRVPTKEEIANLTKRYDTIGQWENVEPVSYTHLIGIKIFRWHILRGGSY